MLHAYLSTPSKVPGTWILDGFPRTADQVDQLVTLPSSSSSSLSSSHVIVIELCASDTVARSRIAHRASTSLSSSSTREDDASASTVSNRLLKYRSELAGILDAFAVHGLSVHKIDASGNAHRTLALCEQVLKQQGEDDDVNIVLVGPPGVGKGTVATQLASLRNATHVSTGDLARAAMTKQTDKQVGIAKEEKKEDVSTSTDFDVDVVMGHMVGFA